MPTLTKLCPHCDEIIESKEFFCPYCGKDVRNYKERFVTSLALGSTIIGSVLLLLFFVMIFLLRDYISYIAFFSLFFMIALGAVMSLGKRV